MTRVTVIVYFGPVPTFFCMALGEDHHVSTLLRVVALFRQNLRFFGLFVISSFFFLVSPTHRKQSTQRVDNYLSRGVFSTQNLRCFFFVSWSTHTDIGGHKARADYKDKTSHIGWTRALSENLLYESHLSPLLT